MARKRFSPEQIIVKLREAEIIEFKGLTQVEAAKKLGICEQTKEFAKNWGAHLGRALWTNDPRKMTGSRNPKRMFSPCLQLFYFWLFFFIFFRFFFLVANDGGERTEFEHGAFLESDRKGDGTKCHAVPPLLLDIKKQGNGFEYYLIGKVHCIEH